MKKIIFAFILLFIYTSVFADEITIPFCISIKKVQEAFKIYDKKLDNFWEEPTEDSWGYIMNKGNEIVLYTYKPMTIEDFNLLNKIFYGTEMTNEVNGSSDN